MSNAIDGGMLVPKPAMAQMFPSGSFVDLLEPAAETIHAEDIAHHLGMLCRYGGGVRRFYSVAEHSVLVADLLAYQGYDRRTVLAGLLHDGAEALIGDLISPAKYALRVLEATKYGLGAERFPADNGAWFVKPDRELRGVFSELADGIDGAIGDCFGINPERFDDPEVKTADMWALRIEARDLTFSRGENWRWPGELPDGGELPNGVWWPGGEAPEHAAERWLSRFEDLTSGERLG